MTEDATPAGDPPRRGPPPERLKIEGDWEEAAKTALERKRPAGGWPKPPKPPKKKGKGK